MATVFDVGFLQAILVSSRAAWFVFIKITDSHITACSDSCLSSKICGTLGSELRPGSGPHKYSRSGGALHMYSAWMNPSLHVYGSCFLQLLFIQSAGIIYLCPRSNERSLQIPYKVAATRGRSSSITMRLRLPTAATATGARTRMHRQYIY